MLMYVDKAKFHGELEKWAEARLQATEAGRDEPEMPAYVSNSILNICNGLARRGNFNGYPFVEEMVGDAIFSCIRAVKNYKPSNEKKNPYGYFTKVAWSAFLHRLEIESKETKKIQDLIYDENHITYTTIDGEAVLNKHELRQNFINFGE